MLNLRCGACDCEAPKAEKDKNQKSWTRSFDFGCLVINLSKNAYWIKSFVCKELPDDVRRNFQFRGDPVQAFKDACDTMRSYSQG